MGLEFQSPTVNLFFTQEDFIKFCLNIEYYLSQDVKEKKTDKPYPVGMIGDIDLFFMHYQSFEDAVLCWNKRKKRIKKDRIIVIGVAPTGTEPAIYESFEKIQYPKIMLCQEKVNGKNTIFVPGMIRFVTINY